ncbi:hypothetical protein BC938DRAFT_475077 [Jimgerdemannia flammicorona]|uniref:Uncharacterized protein n=1 Tax=Jimgerdemannia flammicorona TaxID=994334 RepID=A0A433QZI9_9FUNG|nr:hypothetical protein BC938DRAFT_475077 [Jimgerdemannia flammicorona]
MHFLQSRFFWGNPSFCHPPNRPKLKTSHARLVTQIAWDPGDCSPQRHPIGFVIVAGPRNVHLRSFRTTASLPFQFLYSFQYHGHNLHINPVPTSQRPTPSPLKPKSVNDPTLTPRIAALSVPKPVVAAFHLLNDDITRAHDLSQSMEGEPVADLTQAFLHRREGDYWNSKYWLQRVPERLVKEVVGDGGKKAVIEFVDKCETVGMRSWKRYRRGN